MISTIKFSFVLKGFNTVLDTIKTEDITAYSDLDGYTEGEHEVPF